MLWEWAGPLTQAAVAVALINVLSGRRRRVPLWTCLALGVGGLALAGLTWYIAPEISLKPFHDALRYVVPTLAAVVAALVLIGRTARWARWAAFAVLLVPALWYAGTQVYDLVRPLKVPTGTTPPGTGRLTLPNPYDLDAGWRLATLAWETVQLAIGLALVCAVLAFTRERRLTA